MTLQQLRYISETAAAGSITAAAARLGISQPTLTSSIRDLESELGITIFDRTNRGMRITADGTELLSHARRVLEDVGRIEETYLTDRPSALSVASLRYPFVAQAMTDMVDSCHVTLYEGTLHDVIGCVAAHKCSLGVASVLTRGFDTSSVTEFSEGTASLSHIIAGNYADRSFSKLMNSNGLTFSPLLEAKLHILFRSSHPLAAARFITPKELCAYRYIGYEDVSTYMEDYRGILDCSKVTDRATLTELLLGSSAWTLSIECYGLDRVTPGIAAVPLVMDDRPVTFCVGYITCKNTAPGRSGAEFLSCIKKHL